MNDAKEPITPLLDGSTTFRYCSLFLSLIYFFTDGLTVDSQQFRGKINLSDQVLYSSGALNYGQAKIVQDSQYEGIKITNITHVG